MGRALCHLDSLADGEARGFETGCGPVILVRRDGALACFANQCPHQGKRLDRLPDRFLTFDGAFIKCAHHGALFDMRTGEGLTTPCYGNRLSPLKHTIIDGWVYLGA